MKLTDFGGQTIRQNELARSAIIKHFDELKRKLREPPRRNIARMEMWKNMRNTFVDFHNDGRVDLPVTWYNYVRPTQPNRFLIHILLSMGEFENEMKVMDNADIKQAYERAGLFNRMRPEQSIEKLMRRYIREQLVFLPGGSQQFDRFVVAAHGAFTECLLHDRFPVHDMPSVLYTKLIRRSDKKSEDFIKECHTCLCKTTLEILQRAELEDLPVLEELLQATLLKPSKCFEELQRGKNQSIESNIEQCEVFKHIKKPSKIMYPLELFK